MGVDVVCRFPHGTEIENVAKVAAALLGHKSAHDPYPGSTATFAKVQGWRLNSGGPQVTIAFIVLDVTTDNPVAKLIRDSDNDSYHLMYHFEAKGGPLIMPRCTAAKIALCVGLVKFFGGVVGYNDSVSKDVDFRSPRKKDIDADDDPLWSVLQKRILAVKPLTQKDVDRFKKYAAY